MLKWPTFGGLALGEPSKCVFESPLNAFSGFGRCLPGQKKGWFKESRLGNFHNARFEAL